MNRLSSPASVKSVCAASSETLARRSSPIPGHCRRRDGQQRTAEAVADGVHGLGRDDGVYGVEGCHHAQAAIVVHAQVPIGLGGIAPGDHEDGMTLIDQVFDQGIVRRQIEYVVLHDPGRHDQYGFRMHCGGGGVY